MRIAIMSDSHDNIWNVRRAIEMIEKRAHCIIHCGDLISPFVLKELCLFPGPIHLVSGNNDGEQHLLTKYAGAQFRNVTHHGIIGRLKLEECLIGFTHYYPTARGLATMDQYALVCYGHSHVHKMEEIEGRVLLNPGEIMGKEGPPTFCVFDSVERKIEKVEFLSAIS